MTQPPDPLDPLLDRWSKLPPPSPRLASEVWQRIATHEDIAVPGWRAAVVGWLGRPAFAAGFIAACALLGLFVAEIRVSHVQRERNAQLARSYLSLIDPLLNGSKTESRP